MIFLYEDLIESFNQAIRNAYPELVGTAADITQSTQEKFGHYQCNLAMKLGKTLKKNPREVASTLIEHLPLSLKEKASFEIAGPGFINITFSSAYLNEALQEMIQDPTLAFLKEKKRERVVIDFSSPNVAKQMHVGHLRSTIIGDSLARLFEFLGHDVLRLNHIGDWGTAFGMLIAYIKKEGYGEALASKDLSTLETWYKASKALFDTDPEFKKQSQLEVVALQGGDLEAITLWKAICKVSKEGYQQVYDLLNISLIERGESFYNPHLASVVADLEKKGLLTVSEGAKCLFLEGFSGREQQPLPMIVQKSDGGYNYTTTDLAALKHRVEEEKAERIIIVTDAGQSTHFAMLFQAGEKAAFYDPKKVTLTHVPFGLVLGPDGKKFRTRSGETEKLVDLLETAISKAEEILEERDLDLSSSEKKELAKSLGIGAIKYADLSSQRTQDYQFSYERMLRFEGNTAAFLMYSYVRMLSIQRKARESADPSKEKLELTHKSELALALYLLQFPEALSQVKKDLMPHRLTEYLYGLAEKFNAFFRDCQVVGSKEQKSRELLVQISANILGQGLQLLGLNLVSRM